MHICLEFSCIALASAVFPSLLCTALFFFFSPPAPLISVYVELVYWGHQWQNGTLKCWLPLDFFQSNNLLSWQQQAIVDLSYFSSYKQAALVSNHHKGRSFNQTKHDSVNVSNNLFGSQIGCQDNGMKQDHAGSRDLRQSKKLRVPSALFLEW